jgi:hypothetical protein
MPGVSHQGGSVQYEDTVGVDGDSGVSILGFRNDSDAQMATADLSHTRLSTDEFGRLKILVAGDPWTVTLIADETADDSDKTITVPASTEYQVLTIYIEYTSTATANDRQIQINFLDGAGDVIGQIRPNVVQAASLTRYYMIGPSLANGVAFYDTDHIQTPMPPTIFLPATYAIRIYDNNAVDAAADDMILQVMVASRAT